MTGGRTGWPEEQDQGGWRSHPSSGHLVDAYARDDEMAWDAWPPLPLPSAHRRSRHMRWFQRISYALLGLTVLGVVSGVALVLMRGDDAPAAPPARRPADLSGSAVFPTAVPRPADTAVVTTTATSAPSAAESSATAESAQPRVAISRLVIPIIGVDAPVEVKGLEAGNVMPTPDDPFDVVWYDFSAQPGMVGNAVFAGHLDYRDVGPAVFWELGSLSQGDVIAVYLADGRRIEYQVTVVATFDAATAPVNDIIGATTTQALTLITCAGTFDASTGSYDQRLIVRAEQLASATP